MSEFEERYEHDIYPSTGVDNILSVSKQYEWQSADPT